MQAKKESNLTDSDIQQDQDISLKLALDYLDQGITVINQQLEVVMWNTRFLELLDFPEYLMQERTPLELLFRYNCERGEYGEGDIEQQIEERMDLAKRFAPHCFDRVRPDGTVLEIRGNPIDQGKGFVTIYTDVTEIRSREASLTHKVAQESRALALEEQAHRNAIAVLQESDQVLRQLAEENRNTEPPFNQNVEKVLAQAEAALQNADGLNSRPGVYQFDRWQVDIENRKLSDDKEIVKLSPTEFDLLSILVRNANTVLSRDELLLQARGRVPGPNDRSVDVHIARLRKIFNHKGIKTPVIRTVRNSGYMLARNVTVI